MRINKFIANNASFSRRQADKLIVAGKVRINDILAELGSNVSNEDVVYIDGKKIENSINKPITVLLNKPVGYVCSKDGQGSPTVYDLLPSDYHSLNIAGRLDKDSSGLVVLTSDGNLLQELTHPRNNKHKIYEIETDRALNEDDITQLKSGIDIGDDRISTFKDIYSIDERTYEVVLEEGRNRQIRRSIHELSKEVIMLNRTQIGQYKLEDINSKQYILI